MIKKTVSFWILGLLFLASCRSTLPEESEVLPKNDVFFDFTAKFSTAEIQIDTDLIDLGTEDARNHLFEGWSKSEVMYDGSSFSWSLGERSGLWFNSRTFEDLAIEFRCSPFTFPGSPTQSVVVSINGQSVASIRLAKGINEYRISVPGELIKQGKNEIEFEYGYSRRPADVLDESKDPRQLGVAWDYIRLGNRSIRKPKAILKNPVSLVIPVGACIDYFARLTPGLALAISKVILREGASLAVRIKVSGDSEERVLAEVIEDSSVYQVLTGVSGTDVARISLEVTARENGSSGEARLVYPALVFHTAKNRAKDESKPELDRIQTFKNEMRGSNLIFCLVDAARADHFGTYGYLRDTTPHIDKLAEESILFEKSYSAASYTVASVGSIFTGVYPDSHEVVDESDKLAESWTTLAEFLQADNFETASIISNPFASRAFGYHQGFDLEKRLFLDSPNRSRWEGQADRMVSESIQWLEKKDNNPFFLYLHIREPHEPYFPPSGFKGKFLEVNNDALTSDTDTLRAVNHGELTISDSQNEQFMARYDENLNYSDQAVGNLIGYLKESGLWERSIFVLISDHGEGFGEHGAWLHGSIPYEEMIKVPLIIHLPRTKEGRPNQRCHSQSRRSGTNVPGSI